MPGKNKLARYKDILASRQQDTLTRMNQQVYVRDLILTTEPLYSHGESSVHTNIYSASSKKRLFDHIRFLIDFVNEAHRANYSDLDLHGNYQLRHDKQNHVTRLLMSEFTLYTETPFSMTAFSELVEAILAEKIDPNVHVLLSSFALKDESGQILNMALYIEGGNPPIIHSFVKNTAYSIDITYGGYGLFSQQKRGIRVSFHAESSISETGLSIPMAGIFEVTTQGGACYSQAIDLCSDHTSGHAKALMMRRLRNARNPFELLPEQIEHIISSNSVTRTDVNSISDCVIQADPRFKAHEAQDLHLGERTITDEVITRLTPSK